MIGLRVRFYGAFLQTNILLIPSHEFFVIELPVITISQLVSNLSNTKPIRKNYGKLLKRLGELRIITIFAS